jgi:cation:H+ antiporter
MSPFLLNIVLLLVSAAAIYFSCEFFVNGVEWVGRKFNIEQTATGTILAAFGTALPESVVTFVAVAFGHDETQKQLGIGAALGGPLVLATIAYATVGVMMMMSRGTARAGQPLNVDYRRLSRDQGWFLLIFVVKVALGLVVFAYKPWLGVAFLAGYAAYFWKETTGSTDESEGALEPLKLAPRAAEPSTFLVIAQTAGALVAIFIASQVFVGQLDGITPHLGLSPQLVALFISPIATELPETMNAIIWVRQGKEKLALANISGAMMIQATVPTAFGLFFTPWLLDHTLIIAGVITTMSVLALFALFRRGAMTGRRLALFGLFYVLFVAALLVLKV